MSHSSAVATSVPQGSLPEKDAKFDADSFLRRLGPTHTFQTFGEGLGKGQRGLARVLHGTLAEYADTLFRLNAQGAGIYVMVNGGDGIARRADNVTETRAVFVDLDGSPLEPVQTFSLPPHCIIETSPERWHAYWFTSGVPLEQFKPLQQRIARTFGGDAKVCDLPRVMRLPEFLHLKGKPFRSRIVSFREGPRYSYAEILNAFPSTNTDRVPEAKTKTLAATIPEGERNDELFRLACGLVRNGIPPDGVRVRLQRLNADRCLPPLCASEVDAIAANASGYGSNGFTSLTHKLQDSSEWKALPPETCTIVLAYFRRFNGTNNGRLAVPWRDFKGQHGICSSGRFYRHLRPALVVGILIQVTESRNGQTGRIPAMYAIAEKYLPKPQNKTWGEVAKHDT